MELRGTIQRRNMLIVALSLVSLLLLGGIAILASVWLNPRATLVSVIPVPGGRVSDVPRYAFSIYGRPELPLLKPLAVAEATSGDVYVTDSGHSVVQVFDYRGNYKDTIGKPTGGAPGPGDLRYPIGLTFDDKGRLYVSDSSGGHISIFENGRFSGFFGEGSGQKVFGTPGGIIYRKGSFYLNDLGYHQVLVIGASGQVVREIGLGRGDGPGDLQFANFSAVGDDGNVYVADSNNSRVQIFSSDGALLKGVREGTAGTPLALPRGIALDARGRLHVASTFGHRVETFDSEGRALFSWGRRGEGDGEFNFPNGLYITRQRIYVADRENNRVQVWEY